MKLRDAWLTIETGDYEAHMARIGQAQANATLLAEWLAWQAPGDALIIPGAGPGQFLEYLPPELLPGRPLTLTDIHSDFLSKLRERMAGALVLEDDIEATALEAEYPLAAIVLVLEHVEWRRAILSLRRWRTRRALIVIQENPAQMTSAVTPGLTVPGTMAVFKEAAPPRLVPLADLEAAMARAGYALMKVDHRPVEHGKRMVACHFARLLLDGESDGAPIGVE